MTATDLFGRPVPQSVVDAIVCRPWCVGHTIDGEDSQGRSVVHYGPDFGLLANNGLPLNVDGSPQDDSALGFHIEAWDLDAAALRQLSVDALAAAEWLEAHA